MRESKNDVIEGGISLDASEYLKNPCGMSSLPFWKMQHTVIPDNMVILRDDSFHHCDIQGCDEPYFRLQHDLIQIPSFHLQQDYEVVECSIEDYARHINECYDMEHISSDELKAYTTRSVYDPSLWIAVSEKKSHSIVATGIAELDATISEGVLEWIQVTPSFRHRGLGRSVVCELLRRMQGRARFVTVSGRVKNASNPYSLYCACGFYNPVIWHVIKTN